MHSWDVLRSFAIMVGLMIGSADRSIGWTLPNPRASVYNASAISLAQAPLSIQSVNVPGDVPGDALDDASSHIPVEDASEHNGTFLYQSGQFEAAIAAYQAAVEHHHAEGNPKSAVFDLNTLVLLYERLGRWSDANRAIAASLEQLQDNPDSDDDLIALAQVLEMQGRLQFEQGQMEAALGTWQQAADTFETVNDFEGISRSRLNEAQVLQSLGFHRRSTLLLKDIVDTLADQPNSRLKIVGLRRLGDVLLIIGDIEGSRQSLEESAAIAEEVGELEALAAAYLSLGNNAMARQALRDALAFYQRAASENSPIEIRLQAGLNRLRLLAELGQWSSFQENLPDVWSDLEFFPPSRRTIYGWITLARSLDLAQDEKGDPFPLSISQAEIAQKLTQVYQQAQQLGDYQAESYILGYFGERYAQNNDWEMAQQFTEQALRVARLDQAPELAYRWQWQLGKALRAQGQKDQAIAAYIGAVETLGALRGDVVAVSSELRFSFQQAIEPVYRELVEMLLLEGEQPPDQEDLEIARETVEALKVAELDNFFQAACLVVNPIEIDDIDARAAVFYPIILADRLVTIVRLPGQPLKSYESPAVTPAELAETIKRLRLSLAQPNTRRFLTEAQSLYDWLIRPIEAELRTAEADTLVFVPDGGLQNVPMAVLHDGEQYLIEQYGISITPGLELVSSEQTDFDRFGVLAVGLSESRQEFIPLPFVETEIAQINQLVSESQTLLNEGFTSDALETLLGAKPLPIVHMATHGQFSSRLDETFLLTWDDRIGIHQLGSMLETVELSRSGPIELLVLSACETATGDDRAALGLAGVATRSGARSTLATLWRISDATTATFMEAFYEALLDPNVTKAEAVRQAQLSILKGPADEQHPYFWAAYVLVGNWL